MVPDGIVLAEPLEVDMAVVVAWGAIALVLVAWAALEVVLLVATTTTGVVVGIVAVPVRVVEWMLAELEVVSCATGVDVGEDFLEAPEVLTLQADFVLLVVRVVLEYRAAVLVG